MQSQSPTMHHERRQPERPTSGGGMGMGLGSPARQQQDVNSAGKERRGASEIFRDAKGATAQLKAMLKERSPWSTDIEFTRQKARNFYIATIFSHPLSTYAQTLDPLWLDTSYSLIGAYREAVAKVESRIAVHGPNARSGSRDSGPVELRKVLTRFRQALASEETFYRGLITRIVGFFKLQSLTYPFLNLVAIPVPPEMNGGQEQGLAPDMSTEDAIKKLALVHKGLICLGDIERYKEQYSEKQRRGGRDGAPRDRFAKAQTFYEVARGLLPDNGAPSNQLAVISTYIPDNFLCVYHYYRSLVVPQPFPGAEANLDRVLKKAFDRWRTERHEPPAEDVIALLPEGQFKKDFVVILAVLTLRASTSHMPSMTAACLQAFRDLLAARQMPSEIIVKSLVMAIGAHWQARLCRQAAEEDVGRASKKADSEALALEFLLGLATILLELAAQEVADGLSEEDLEGLENGEPVGLSGSALLDDDDELATSRASRRRRESGEGQSMASSVVEVSSSVGSDSPSTSGRYLSQSITAVTRRLLPSLRIFSKWIKSNLEYLIRTAIAPSSPSLADQLLRFWAAYCRSLNCLQVAFPVARLPSLTEPLEEDVDMRGFTPLKRGVMEPAARSESQAEDGEEVKDVHPNEEQLMRVADLIMDGKLLAQAERAGIVVIHERFVLRSPENLTAAALHAQPFQPAIKAVRPEEELELASVSTETEDDPVNLAMRATMADGSSVDGEEIRDAGDDDDDDEQIVWQRPSTVTSHAFGSPQHLEPSTSARGFSRTNTAHDLLSSLVLNTPRAPVTPTAMSTKLTSPPGPSPALLFGGDALSGSGNIWSIGGEADARGPGGAWKSDTNKLEPSSFVNTHPSPLQHPPPQHSYMGGPPPGFQPPHMLQYASSPLEGPSVPPPMQPHYGHPQLQAMHPGNPQLYSGFAPGPFDTQYGIGRYPQQHFESWSQQQPPPSAVARSNAHFGPQDQPGYWG